MLKAHLNQRFVSNILIGLAFFHIGTLPLQAKRGSPKPVKPVTINSIRYSASADPDQMGFVIATDVVSGKELWRQRIYRVFVNPAKERDVQWVFITTLIKQDHSLKITNERGERFSLDLIKRSVRKLGP